LQGQRDKGLSNQFPSLIDDITDLYQGDFLAYFHLPDSESFEKWAVDQRRQLRESVIAAHHIMGVHYLESGDFESAQLSAWNQLKIDRLNEAAYRQLMTALTQDFQPVASIAQYENLCRLLMADSGSVPSPKTTALYDQIRVEALPKDPIRHRAEVPELDVVDQPMPVFLFTDIENSTPLWDRYRDAVVAVIRQHNDILVDQIHGFGGRILEFRGDGVDAVFEGGQPLECALEIQKKIGQFDWGGIGELRLRIGLHGTPVNWEGDGYFREGDEYWGPVLNYTARVMSAAWGGQILASKYVRDARSLPDGATWQDYGEHDLKGAE
jgi:class 3 adenylate cyclase